MAFPELTDQEYAAHLLKVAKAAQLEIAEPTIPSQHVTIANGIRLSYLDWGGSGIPILFLHGGGLNAHSWDFIAQVFSHEYRCLALDQRGHGRSEWSPSMDYRPSDYAKDCIELIQQLSLNRPILVGTSMGGVNALAIAALGSESLGAVILLDVGLNVEPNPGRTELRQFMTGALEANSIEDIVTKGFNFNSRRDPEMLRTTLRWNVIQLPNNKWTWRYDRRHRQHDEIWSIIASSRESLIESLSSIQCPVLIVRGANSKVVSQEDVTFLSSRIPDSKSAEIPAAGHAIHGDNPKETVRVIKDFLAKRL